MGEVHPEQGLSEESVRVRRREHGWNRLGEPEGRSAPRVLADQSKSTVVVVLLVAAALAVAAQQWTESVAIVAVLVVNAGIGFVSEWRARRSMQALRELGRHDTRVRRDRKEIALPAEELVPGDVLLIEAGDLVPADARLLEGEGIPVNEAALTGESASVPKTPDPIDADAPLVERTNMLFRGTSVADGRGEAVVCSIGEATELGRIAELAEGAEAAEKPLEKRLDRLGRRLAVITLLVAAAIAAIQPGVASHAKSPSPRLAAQLATSHPHAPQAAAMAAASTAQRPMFVRHAGRRRSCGRRCSSASPSAKAASPKPRNS